MKIYNLIFTCQGKTSLVCNSIPFTSESAAQIAMRAAWANSLKEMGFDTVGTFDTVNTKTREYECRCLESMAIVRNDEMEMNWRIDEYEVNASVTIDVHEGMVQAVYANADIGVDVLDRDITGDDEALDEVEKALADCIAAPLWRAVW